MPAIDDSPALRFTRQKHASAALSVHQREEFLFYRKGGGTVKNAQASTAGQGAPDFQGGTHQDPMVRAQHMYQAAGHLGHPLRSGEVFVQLVATF
jgi:hypothetical protein